MRLHHKLFYLGACFALALGGWSASALVDAPAFDMTLKLVGWMAAIFGVPVGLLWLAEWIAPERSTPQAPAGSITPAEPPRRRAG